MPAPARTLEQRIQDARARLEQDVDAGVATADPGGGLPYLIPLSFLWDGEALLIATPAASPTARNLAKTGNVRLGLGPTRDVLIVEGIAEAVDELSGETGDAFTAKAGFDPRKQPGFAYFRIVPRLIQAWREVNELKGRTLMRDGTWLAS